MEINSKSSKNSNLKNLTANDTEVYIVAPVIRASSAVAEAAIKDGAARKITDIADYTKALEKKVEELWMG